MLFRFLHTSDWQIGKPFKSFPDDVGALLRDARVEVISTLGTVASAEGVRHVLVAGDVFDQELLPARELLAGVERMRAQGHVHWHLLPGNHDPARVGGLWDRLLAGGLPDNVRCYVHAGPVPLERGVWLLPAPLARGQVAADPTSWMDGCTVPPGELRIGLAHGSVQGFGSEGVASVAINPRRVAAARLDYLALGDWHGRRRVCERCWYSGTPEPDRYLDNDAGSALLVALDGTGPPRVEPRPTARYTWARRSLELREGVDPADIVDGLRAELFRLAPALDRVLLRLELAGSLSLKARADLVRRLEALTPSLRHLHVDAGRLRLAAGALNEDLVGEAGEIAEAARWLRARSDAAPEGSADRRTALDALVLLHDLLAEADAEAGT